MADVEDPDEWIDKIIATASDVYAETNQGPMLWKDVCQDLWDTLEERRSEHKKAQMYDALKAAGVENWEWYEEATKEFYE